MTLRARKIVNFISFYLAWPFCVIPAAHHHPLWGPILCLPLVLIHFFVVCTPDERRHEFRLMMVAVALGFILDSSLWKFNLVIYTPSPWPAPFAPLWILALWATFANAFRYSLQWLGKHPLLPIVFGLLGGPLGFLAAKNLGALALHPKLWPSFLALSVAWGIAVPLLSKLARSPHFKLP